MIVPSPWRGIIQARKSKTSQSKREENFAQKGGFRSKESVKRYDRTWSCAPFAGLVTETGRSFSTRTRWLPVDNGAFVRNDRRTAARLKSAYHGITQRKSGRSARPFAPPIW